MCLHLSRLLMLMLSATSCETELDRTKGLPSLERSYICICSKETVCTVILKHTVLVFMFSIVVQCKETVFFIPFTALQFTDDGNVRWQRWGLHFWQKLTNQINSNVNFDNNNAFNTQPPGENNTELRLRKKWWKIMIMEETILEEKEGDCQSEQQVADWICFSNLLQRCQTHHAWPKCVPPQGPIRPLGGICKDGMWQRRNHCYSNAENQG